MAKVGLESFKQSRVQVGISNAKIGIVICSRDVDAGGGLGVCVCTRYLSG